MREYSNIITLSQNSRGVYSLDPSIGCSSGLSHDPKGCFSDCYAARYAKKYGYNFSKTKLRYFKSDKHAKSIARKINAIDMPFVRMGTSGDPSENWKHTVDVIKKLGVVKKEIVIITKHWTNISNYDLLYLAGKNICINTSISPLDRPDILKNGLFQYGRLGQYLKSVLRVVSCDFNINNPAGHKLSIIQDKIFQKYNVLDTVLRVSKKNDLVVDGVINIKETKFLGKKCNVSKYNKKTFFGSCYTCIEKCGLNMNKNNE